MNAFPGLPEPSWRENRPTNPPKVAAEWFTAHQMIEYATACVAAERRRCIEICRGEMPSAPGPWEGLTEGQAGKYWALADVISDIRKGDPIPSNPSGA